MTSKVPTRFMIISDTHDYTLAAAPPSASFVPPFPEVDVLLHCGDLTNIGGSENYRKFLDLLSNIKAELKLVIAGNHDLTLDQEFVSSHGQSYMYRNDPNPNAEHEEALEIMKGPEAKAAGVTYLEEGTYTFSLKNGAVLKIHASPYSPEFYDWAFMYPRDQDRYNGPEHAVKGAKCVGEHPIPEGADIVMTHGPPMGILDQVMDGSNVGCEHLMRAVKRVKPLVHCFGHIHEGYGARLNKWDDGTEHEVENKDWREPREVGVERGQTLFVNAAIRNVNMRAVNMPWVLDLELDRAS